MNWQQVYKLMEENKTHEAVKYIDKCISGKKVTPQQQHMASVLKAYALTFCGRQGEAYNACPRIDTPSAHELQFLQYLDCLFHMVNNKIAQDLKTIRGTDCKHAEVLYNLHVAIQLFNRRFESMSLKFTPWDRPLYREREELALQCQAVFFQLVQGQSPNHSALISRLNTFLSVTDFSHFKNQNAKQVMNQRIHRQHAYSIVTNIVTYIAIQQPELLAQVSNMPQINEQIIRVTNPRLYLFVSKRYAHLQDILQDMISWIARPNTEQASQYLLQHYKEIQDKNALLRALSGQESLNQYQILLKYLITSDSSCLQGFHKNLSNMMLVRDLYRDDVLDRKQLDGFGTFFCSLATDTLDSVDLASVRQMIEEYSGQTEREAKVIECACKFINSVEKCDLYPSILEYFQQFSAILKPYHYINLRLGFLTPSEFCRDIQISNYLYLTALPLALDSFLEEDYTAYKQRNGFDDSAGFYTSSAFCKIHRLNHTNTELWEVQHVVEGAVYFLSQLMYQNYVYINESLLQCCNLVQAARLFESKRLALNVDSYYCQALYTCLQLNSAGPHLERERLLSLFAGTTGRLTGTSFESFKLLYGPEGGLLDLADGAGTYMVARDGARRLPLAEVVQPLVGAAVNRKKAAKAVVCPPLLRRDGVYYSHLYQQPQPRRAASVRFRDVFYHAALKTLFVRLASGAPAFAPEAVALCGAVRAAFERRGMLGATEALVSSCILDFFGGRPADLGAAARGLAVATVGDFLEGRNVLAAFASVQQWIASAAATPARDERPA